MLMSPVCGILHGSEYSEYLDPYALTNASQHGFLHPYNGEYHLEPLFEGVERIPLLPDKFA